MNIRIEDHSGQTLSEVGNKIKARLTECGLRAEGYAKALCPVDTGDLRNSIAFKVDGNTMYVGTNVEYAPYQEFGTGQQSIVGGQQTIKGIKPHPFLKPSIADHADEYNNVINR